MTTLSIALLDPDLANHLRKSSSSDLRRVARSIAHLVVDSTFLEEPVVTRALDVLDNDSIASEELRNQLWSKVEALDEIQWSLHDAADEGLASMDDYSMAFSKARAANAVFCALASDPLEAASDCLYEAHAATSQLDALRAIALRTLGNSA